MAYVYGLSNLSSLGNSNLNGITLPTQADTNLAQNNRSVSDDDSSSITANNAAELSDQAQATSASQAAKNSGVNSSAASLTGSQSATTNTSSTANSIYTAQNAQKASTQADYLKRMGELCGLCYAEKNMGKANIMNTIGALMGSDENMKHGIMGKAEGGKTTCAEDKSEDKSEEKGCLDPNALNNAIKCFYSLKKQLDDLKKRRK